MFLYKGLFTNSKHIHLKTTCLVSVVSLKRWNILGQEEWVLRDQSGTMETRWGFAICSVARIVRNPSCMDCATFISFEKQCTNLTNVAQSDTRRVAYKARSPQRQQNPQPASVPQAGHKASNRPNRQNGARCEVTCKPSSYSCDGCPDC